MTDPIVDTTPPVQNPTSSSGSRLRKLIWPIRVMFLFLAYNLFPVAIGILLLPSRLDSPPHLQNGLVPVGTSVPPKPAADVIFVHGLGSFPDSTWHKPSPGERTRYPEGVHWIRDLLPMDIPNARLLMFNYDSTTYNNAPQKTLETIGNELLFSIKHSRANSTALETDYPTIFVCHSYGGLVVKEALRIASTEAKGKSSNPLRHTWGIIFLGVPHAGTENWKYSYRLAQYLSSIGSNPNIFLPLAPASKYLAKLQRDFMKSYARVKTVNFFETRKQNILPILGRFSPTRMIVPMTSVTFNGTHTENYSLDCDYSGLNKYNNATDPGYVKIMSTLKYMMQIISEEEYIRIKRKLGSNDAWSQVNELRESSRCDTDLCDRELSSAMYHILTDKSLIYERMRAKEVEEIKEMEDGWWKTTYSWLAWFRYMISHPILLEMRNERYDGFGGYGYERDWAL